MGKFGASTTLPPRVIYRGGNECDRIHMQTRPVEATRLINARALAGDTGPTGMARMLRKAPVQLQNAIGKTPKKAIGKDLAREIESAYGKPEGWLDMPWDLMMTNPLATDASPVEAPGDQAFAIEGIQIALASAVDYLRLKQPGVAAEFAAHLRKQVGQDEKHLEAGVVPTLLALLEKGQRKKGKAAPA